MEHEEVPGKRPGRGSFLIVDDNSVYCDRLLQEFAEHGYADVAAATTFEDALALADARKPDRAIVDMRLEDRRNGFDLIRELRRRSPALLAVVVTDYPSLSAFREAVAAGAVDLITKRTDVPEILHSFARSGRSWTDMARIPLVPPTLAQVEWEHINRVLSLVDGNATLAAEILGISRATLYRKMQSMPVENWSASTLRAQQLAWSEARTKRRSIKEQRQRQRRRQPGGRQ